VRIQAVAYDDITYEIDHSILTVTLNRPERLNSCSLGTIAELTDAFDRADRDPDIRAVIITGAGRSFCAGADLSGGGDTFNADVIGQFETVDHIEREPGGLLTLRIFDCAKPVIAAINGPAIGIGVTMTLPMDIRLASETARFGFVFARRGIVPESCSSWFLPRVAGLNRALEWMLTGRVFGADEALAGGLVRSVHPPDELLGAARALADEIVRNCAPVSVALTRQMLWKGLTADHPAQAHRVESLAMMERSRSADVREGIAAFLEKRPAAFPMNAPDGLPEFYPWWRDRILD
jgi:enoyl-CoA hydratase/carnithine racemase